MEIHWFSIINSFITVLFLSAIFGAIIVRTLSNDIAKYNEDDDDEVEPTGWKLVHGDVFRPPPHFGVLTMFVGTGIQLFGVFAVTLLFALLGMLSPASRGALMTVTIVVWLFMGASGGYYSSRLYKTLGGTQWKENGMKTVGEKYTLGPPARMRLRALVEEPPSTWLALIFLCDFAFFF